MKIYTIPNFITLGNLSLGILGIYIVFNSRIELAAYCILGSAILDFLDGLVARLFNSYSSIGKELDSLADMVSFGVLPSFILFYLLNNTLPNDCYSCPMPNPWVLTAIIPALFSALRLAKFNVDTRQTDSFLGLPTPSNAVVVASFVLMMTYQSTLADQLLSSTSLIIYSIVISLLMIVDLPMMSLKFKSLAIDKNKDRYTFVLLALILGVILKFAAIPAIIALYVLYSLIRFFILKPKVLENKNF